MKRFYRLETMTLLLFATSLPAIFFPYLFNHSVIDEIQAWAMLVVYALVLAPLADRIDKGHDRTKEHKQ